MKRKLLIAVLIIAVCVFAFAACNDANKEPEHLSPVDGSTITYDGDTVSWGAVDHAEGYWVYLNDDSEYFAVSENKMSIRLSENVKFSILSVANNADYISAESKGSASFTYLPMIEKIEIEQRTTDKKVGQDVANYETSFDHFKWNAVDGAEYYLLKENGATETVSYQPEEGETVLKQPIGANFDSKGGTASLAILPKSDVPNTYSHWSDVKTVIVLADPSNFSYNREVDLISWKPSDNSSSYQLKIGNVGDFDDIEWKLASGNYYVYSETGANDETVENFQMQVKAIGNIENDVLDSRVVSRSFQQLEPLKNLSVKFGELTWLPNSVTTDYQVRISVTKVAKDKTETVENLVDTVVSGSSYFGTYDAIYNEEVLGGSVSKKAATYTAYVRPILASQEMAEDVVSYANWSTVTFNLLDTPELTYAGNNAFVWNSVNGASAYNIWLYRNGVSLYNSATTNDNALSFEYDFAKYSGTYELRIAALNGKYDGTNASRKSEPFTIVVTAAPSEYTLMSSTYDAETLTSQTSDNHSELNFFFNDVYAADYYVASHYYDLTYVNSGDYDEVTDPLDPNNKTKLARQSIEYTKTVDNPATTDVNEAKLGINNVSINNVIAGVDGRIDTVYLFAKSKYASYRTVDNNGDPIDEITYVKYVKVGDVYTFAPIEEGDPKNMIIMNGEDSTPVQITKLAAPLNVKINGNVISWDRVSRASGYSVLVICNDGNGISTSQKVYNNSYTLALSEAGQYNIFVKALGNGNIILDSIYGTAVSVIKLPAVTDVKLEDQGGATNLVWTPQTFGDRDYNAQSYEVRIGNYVFTQKDTNRVNLESYKQYLTTSATAVTVIAKGENHQEANDQKVLIDANPSDTISLFKLATPTALTVQSNALTWGAADQNATIYKVYVGTRHGSSNPEDPYVGEWVTVEGLTSMLFNEANGFTKDKYGEGYEFLFKVVAAREDNDYRKTSDGYFVDSEESVQLQISMLAVPEVTVEQGTGIATWQKVTGASSYLVKISVVGDADSEMDYAVTDMTNSDTISFVPTIMASDGQTVRISVTAIGNNITYFNSFSYYYETKIKKLDKVATKAGESFSVTINTNDKGVAESFTVHVYDADEVEPTLGQGYIVNVGGIDHEIDKSTGDYTVENLTAGNYNIKVYAHGGNYEGEVTDEMMSNTLYVNSDPSEVQTIKVLAAPLESDVQLSYGGLGDLEKRLVTFASVDGAKGYKLDYEYLKRKSASEIDQEVDYDTINSGSLTFDVGGNTANGYIDNYGRVCFVLDDVDENVNVVKLTITVLGNGTTSVSNAQTSTSKTIR